MSLSNDGILNKTTKMKNCIHKKYLIGYIVYVISSSLFVEYSYLVKDNVSDPWLVHNSLNSEYGGGGYNVDESRFVVFLDSG